MDSHRALTLAAAMDRASEAIRHCHNDADPDRERKRDEAIGEVRRLLG